MRLKRMVIAGLLGAALTMGAATPARALTQGEEAGFSLLAAAANLFYTPAKTVVAIVGLPVGAFAGWVSGGESGPPTPSGCRPPGGTSSSPPSTWKARSRSSSSVTTTPTRRRTVWALRTATTCTAAPTTRSGRPAAAPRSTDRSTTRRRRRRSAPALAEPAGCGCRAATRAARTRRPAA